jgi:hypothetical protein
MDDACVDTLILTQTITETGCSKSQEFVIHVDHWETEIIGKRLICEGDEKQSYSNNMKDMSKKWIVAGGEITGPDDKDTVSVIWGNTVSSLLSLILTSENGDCSDTTTIKITIDNSPAPNPEVIGKIAVCDFDIEEYHTISNDNNTYKWAVSGGKIIGPDTNNSVKVEWGTKVHGMLSLTESTPAGCKTLVKKRIYINSVGLVIEGEFEICNGGTYSYHIESLPGTRNKWSAFNGTILTDPASDTVTVKWAKSGMKILNLEKETITDSKQCTKVISSYIEDETKTTILAASEVKFNPKDEYDNIIAIPIYIKDPGCLLFENKVDSIKASIRLRKSLFLPLTNENQQYSDSGIWRIVEVELPVNYTKAGDTLFSILGYGLLGDTLESPIHIDSLDWCNAKIPTTFECGKLELTGIPDIGGFRLLKHTNIEIITIYPVPANKDVNIIIRSENSGIIKAELYNYLGERAYENNYKLEKGIQELKIQINELLPPGAYKLLLTNKDVIVSGSLLIY